jgi:hypothetical protein
MIYGDYLSTAESQRWLMDTDIPWHRVDPELAHSDTALLQRVRDSALIESFFPIFTCRAMEVLWEDAAATAVFSVQLYESYKHFHVFNQYLELAGYRPIADDELIDVRRRNASLRYEDGTHLLTRYMISEHFAAFHFLHDAGCAPDPVLRRILQLVGRDELRHTQFAYDLLAMRISRMPGESEKVLDAAARFRHIGLEVVPEIPIAGRNEFAAVVTMSRKVMRLTGRPMRIEEWGLSHVQQS